MTDQAAQSEVPSRRLAGATLSTQVMVLGWCVWIAGSWGVALLVGPLIPAARWLMMLALMGLMLVWPAVRLSGSRVRMGPRGVWVEWLCLVLVLQAAVWPLRLLSQWRMDQALWLSGALAAWSLLTAAVVAVGVQGRGCGVRTLAMAGCVLLVVGEPAALALVASLDAVEPWAMRANPLTMVWGLMQPALNVSLDPWPGQVTAAAAAAIAAWVVVVLTRRRPGAMRR